MHVIFDLILALITVLAFTVIYIDRKEKKEDE